MTPNLFRRWPFVRAPDRRRILVIDDFVPDPTIGYGTPRARELLRALSATGAKVVLWPTSDFLLDRFKRIKPHGAIVIHDRRGGLERFLGKQSRSFDCIIVSRPHNMRMFRQLVSESPKLASPTVIYDAEAIFAEREIVRREMLGAPLSASEARQTIEEELNLAASADIVLAVNALTADKFLAAGHKRVRILRYAVALQPTPEPFDQRDGFLFVGPTRVDREPNSDAVIWFVDHILPRLRGALGRDVTLMLAGMSEAPSVRARRYAGLDILGAVPALTGVYSRARVFVAPTRFAAGVPLKVYDAAAHGVPSVITPLLARHLGWTHDEEALVAKSPGKFASACLRLHSEPALWQRIRSAALARVAEDCSIDRFDQTVADIVSDIPIRRHNEKT